MKFLTEKQKLRLWWKEAKVGDHLMFPRTSLRFADNKEMNDAETLHLSIFGKQINNYYFVVKEICGGTLRGNFDRRPSEQDFYVDKWNFEYKYLSGFIISCIFMAPCFMIYNLYKKVVK